MQTDPPRMNPTPPTRPVPRPPALPPLDRRLEPALRAAIDSKTKPLGALGRLESLALHIGLLQGSTTPRIDAPQLVVFAGDHGAARDGISAYPQDVTWQMVENFLAGGAAINVFARQAGWTLTIVDSGVAHDFGPRPGLVDRKIAPGTASFIQGPAMSAAQRDQALDAGMTLVTRLPGNVIALGEMGIGNTAASSLLMHTLTDVPLADCVGPGTGLDPEGVRRKTALLEQALAANGGRQAVASDPLEALRRYGGFEIAMMTGAAWAAAATRRLLVVDGFIATAAVLVAARAAPAVLDCCVFAHGSGEPGHARLLAALAAQPLFDLGLRLGEGTGAALALPFLQAACGFVNEMATFDDAGVSESR